MSVVVGKGGAETSRRSVRMHDAVQSFWAAVGLLACVVAIKATSIVPVNFCGCCV